MQVRVKLFAILKDAAGTGELVLDVPEGVTVRSAAEALAGRVPSLRRYLPPARLVASRACAG